MSVYVLDASVAVSSSRRGDENHARAKQHLTPLLMGIDSIVVPSIFEVEVVASLARVGMATAEVRRVVDGLLARARVVTLGPRAARAASDVAARARLRTGDAIYTWVALREGLPLVTFDGEILARAHLAGVSAAAP